MLNHSSTINELPTPDEASRLHSKRVQSHIITEIAKCGGRIPFSRFMELALYAPGLGYYSAGNQKFGEAGDFITAPEISPLFSRALATQISQILTSLPNGTLLEFGAGQGTMAADIMLELERIHRLPESYQILEISADLQQRQQQTIQEKVPHLVSHFKWIDRLPAEPFNGVIVANELLDAMPVNRFVVNDGKAAEIQVIWNGQTFDTEAGSFQSAAAAAAINQLINDYQLADGYSSEINNHGTQWIKSMAANMNQGAMILIDYGFPQHEYYHPQRNSGTIMCHFRHRSHPNPLILPGIQDITAHVDFTAMATAAVESGLEVRGYTSQASFLLGCGITQLIATEMSLQQATTVNQAVLKLTSPSEMGELFKVLILGKGIRVPLIGTSIRDDRSRL